jgi:hypothetical protein
MAEAGWDDLKAMRWLVTVRARILGFRYEEVSPDVLAIIEPDGQRHTVSLAPLSRAATALPRSEWTAAVDEFLTRTLAVDGDDAEDLDAILPLLRTKLVPEGAAEQGSAVYGEFGQDLVEGLVVDRALTMEWVTTERAERWSATEGTLLRRGRENVRAGGRLDVATEEVGGVRVTLLTGDDYASTHLFWLDEYGLVGAHGALVSVPSRTSVLVAPIVAGTNGFTYLGAMAQLTMVAYGEARHPVMPRIYHWEPRIMDIMGQVLGAALLQRSGDRMHVIVNPAFQESQEALV